MADRVRPMKIESLERGTQLDMFPSALNPNEDHIEARGLFIQNDESDDEAVGVGREGDDLVLTAERTSVRGELSHISHTAVNASGVHQVTGETQTLDATPTPILSLTLTPRRVYWLEAKLVASEDEGNDRAYFVRAVLSQCYPNGDVVLGDVQTSTTDKTVGWEVGFAVNGGAVELTVTGSEDQTVNWAATLSYQSVAGGDNNPLLFQSDLLISGPSNLSHDITLNGQTVAPTFRYEAKDISGTTWHAVVGEDLTASTAADIVPTPFTDGAVAALSKGTYLGSSSQGNVDKQNFLMEFIVRPSGSTYHLASKKASTPTTFPGWMLYAHSNGTPYITIADDQTNAVGLVNSSIRLTEGAFNYVVMAFEHGNVIRRYVNGQRTTDVDVSHIVGSLASPADFRCIPTPNSEVPYFAMWDGDLDFSDLDSVVAQRFAKLTGVYPQVARGTPDPTFTRATGALLDITDDDGITRLHPVPSGWPRLCQRKDADGILRRGYLSERLSTNWLLHTIALDNAVWVKSNTNVILNAAPGPLGDLFGLANTAPGSFIEQIVDVTAVAHTLSFIAKAGVDSVIGCGIRGDEHTAEFDLSNGTVISTASATARIRPWGDGRYRCEMTFTPTAGSATVGIGSLTTGDGVTPNIYLGLVQLEMGQMATSFIPTTTSAATRNGDVLSYVGDDGNATYGTGAIGITMLASPPYPGSWFYTLALYRSDDAAHIATRGNGQYLRFLAGANTSNTTLNQFDEKQHRVGLAYEEGSVQRYHNGELGTPVGWTGIPTGVPDRIWIGTAYTGMGQPNGILSDVKLYNKKIAP